VISRYVRDAGHQRSSARAADGEAVTVNEARHEETVSLEEGRSGAAISWLSWDPCIYYIARSTTAKAHVRVTVSEPWSDGSAWRKVFVPSETLPEEVRFLMME